MDTGIKVGDCMKSRLVTIDEKASVFEAAKKMADNNVGSLLVEKNGRIYGIVTDSDLVKKCLALKKTNCDIAALASKPLVGISADSDLSEAAREMGRRKVRRLVVIKGKSVAGMISSTDIIKISPSLYDLIAEKQSLV
ncbi:MAG TPA: CBS domain-containing protein [Candidatus Norongarragalinales archaeon]|nr:CBS domain-containing protein [Candidatus Norongarragalinales archaeon]